MHHKKIRATQIEMWGGVECTVNRVGNVYFDQLEKSGHAKRLDDLNKFAELGLKSLRTPVLWERIAPKDLDSADWSSSDEYLERVRQLGMKPIVGIIHHGSGPSHTNLIDRAFPEKLAEYARAVALRYPWVEDYTPVNEPLTTARFSGLYGHWYPHGTDPKTFLRALIIQCRATVLAMRAIREITPYARLVQTEDLCKVFSNGNMTAQADFENERRWLSLDLLCGKVVESHPLWSYLLENGVEPFELEWFYQNPCAPDIIGLNYYITSERFLDDRLERYPPSLHGGNDKCRYVDIEAVRVRPEGIAGPTRLLAEVWERYGLPLAITEAHLGCTRDDQLRWFKQIWDSATKLQREGVDILAVTAWSLLGSYNWNSLVTRDTGNYEPGVFDLRGSTDAPRPTALARLIRELANGEEPSHPILNTPGWWQRFERFIYKPKRQSTKNPDSEMANYCERSLTGANVRPLLISGGQGTLAKAFVRICHLRGIPYRCLSKQEMDIADIKSLRKAFDEYDPWAVINAAGYVRVDDAEKNPKACFRENTLGAANLASVCSERGVQLVTFSSDLVFNGKKSSPYLESDKAVPINVYGQSKAKAERTVLDTMPSALIIRTSAFFGPWDEYNFVTIALRSIQSEGIFRAAKNLFISPTYVPDLVNASLDLLFDCEKGIWHLSNTGSVSWADLAKEAACRAGLNANCIEAIGADELGFTALRPINSVLGSERGVLLPTLDDALSRYFGQRSDNIYKSLKSSKTSSRNDIVQQYKIR